MRRFKSAISCSLLVVLFSGEIVAPLAFLRGVWLIRLQSVDSFSWEVDANSDHILSCLFIEICGIDIAQVWFNLHRRCSRTLIHRACTWLAALWSAITVRKLLVIWISLMRAENSFVVHRVNLLGHWESQTEIADFVLEGEIGHIVRQELHLGLVVGASIGHCIECIRAFKRVLAQANDVSETLSLLLRIVVRLCERGGVVFALSGCLVVKHHHLSRYHLAMLSANHRFSIKPFVFLSWYWRVESAKIRLDTTLRVIIFGDNNFLCLAQV